MGDLETIRARAASWAQTRLGRECLYDFVERSRKSVEESAELAQAVGLAESEALRIVMHVYSKKPGEPKQELAGVFMTVLLAATALGYDLFSIMSEELTRVEGVDQDIISARQQQKFNAGISAYGGNL